MKVGTLRKKLTFVRALCLSWGDAGAFLGCDKFFWLKFRSKASSHEIHHQYVDSLVPGLLMMMITIMIIMIIAMITKMMEMDREAQSSK